MCQITRYPAAFPLHSLLVKSVVRAFTQFISTFGIPRVIQSDQGSNFTSHMFKQVLKQLGLSTTIHQLFMLRVRGRQNAFIAH